MAAWKVRALEASTQMTGEKWTLVGVLFAMVVGAVKLVKPRIVGMLARDEAVLAAVDAERAARLELLQQEVASQKARIEALELADRESFRTITVLEVEQRVGETRIAHLTAEKALAEARVVKLEEDLEELVERSAGELSAAEAERDLAVARAREQDEELSRLRTSAVQMRAQVDSLRRGAQ